MKQKCHPLDHQVPCGDPLLCLEMPVNIITVHIFHAYPVRSSPVQSSQVGVMHLSTTLNTHTWFVIILVKRHSIEYVTHNKVKQ